MTNPNSSDRSHTISRSRATRILLRFSVCALVFKPAHTVTVLPFTSAGFPLVVIKCSRAMLFALEPLSRESAPVWPNKSAFAILAPDVVLALVDLPIWPAHAPVTVKIIFRPLASVDPTIAPIVATLTVKHIVLELSAELRSVRPMKNTKAAFGALLIATTVPAAIWVSFCTFAMGRIICPLSFVMAAIRAHDSAVACSAGASPLASVDITI
mmetsp:Transcript_62080/g.108675  ORF Transcript_62080/g.108675 Transcript_62080/m.108675 type:complete len:212 (+) Transcript_62080:41-676(+)